jgi:hypothetical protein
MRGRGLIAGVLLFRRGAGLDRPAPGLGVAAGACGGSPAGPGHPYALYTHCGVDEARIDGKYYEAVHPLSDGQGNPPAGWGNPYQRGSVTLTGSGRAVFTDADGHRVVFDVRPGATSFLHACS